jgi:hypothetical protein
MRGLRTLERMPEDAVEELQPGMLMIQASTSLTG